MGQVRLDRPLADKERGGDFAVGAGFRDERGDAALCRRQALDARPPADPAELRACLLGPCRRPELLELVERRADRVASGAFLPLAPADDTEREQRASASEAISGMFVLRDGVFEE